MVFNVSHVTLYLKGNEWYLMCKVFDPAATEEMGMP